MIKFLHHVSIKPPLRLPSERGGRIDDCVHHGMGKIQHEGLCRISLVFEKIDRLLGVEAHQPSHVPAAARSPVVLVELN